METKFAEWHSGIEDVIVQSGLAWILTESQKSLGCYNGRQQTQTVGIIH